MEWVDSTCRMCEIDHSITAGAKVKYRTAIKATATGLFLFFGALANAEKIVLQDGSTINGEVVSLQSGSYKVKTDSLGVITLQQHQVKSISYDTVPTWSLDSLDSMKQASQSAVQSLQSSISSAPRMMSSILELQNDPDMQAVLSDPELMRAVQSFDLEALRNNPKIQKLMNNTTVRDIQGDVD
jgi:hypothetical protein